MFSQHRAPSLGHAALKDVFCVCASCALACSADAVEPHGALMHWERDVTSELESRELSTAPFCYSLERLYKLDESSDFAFEERVAGRCCCAGRPFGVRCSLGDCASKSINRGGVARKLVVRQCGCAPTSHGSFAG